MNKTIMDYCMQFTRNVEVRQFINYIRLFKGVYLLFEIICEYSKKISDYFIIQYERSTIL